MKIFKILEQIKQEPSKNGKLVILKANDSEELRTFLELTYNKFKTYRIKQIDYPNEYNIVQPNIIAELKETLDILAEHGTGLHTAKATIRRLLAKCTEENAQWVAACILRDLNIGIDESTINKAFPGLIPVFKVQLAHTADDLETLKYPILTDQKLDGLRTLCVVKDGKAKFFSREGREFTCLDVIGKEILKLMPGVDFVLDGECIGKTPDLHNKTTLKHLESGAWPFYQAQSMLKTDSTTDAAVSKYLGYYVWDVIDYTFFATQGLTGKKQPLKERSSLLFNMFSRHEIPFNNLHLVPNVICHNSVEVIDLFRSFRNQGAEGLMLKSLESPYEFKRSNAVLKLKEMFSVDLRVVDVIEGESKYEGMLGAAILASDDGKIRTKVGSGYTDDDRMDLYMLHLEGKLIGEIWEINAQEVTADGSLRFPVFMRRRLDKTVTSEG